MLYKSTIMLEKIKSVIRQLLTLGRETFGKRRRDGFSSSTNQSSSSSSSAPHSTSAGICCSSKGTERGREPPAGGREPPAGGGEPPAEGGKPPAGGGEPRAEIGGGGEETERDEAGMCSHQRFSCGGSK